MIDRQSRNPGRFVPALLAVIGERGDKRIAQFEAIGGDLALATE
jgi:hypothetical protein